MYPSYNSSKELIFRNSWDPQELFQTQIMYFLKPKIKLVLHQLLGGSTGPGNSLLCFHSKSDCFIWLKQPTFYRGFVLTSYIEFSSDGA